MTAGEYGTPTHYLKGKDIKQQGDCLVYCFLKNIQIITKGRETHTDGYNYDSYGIPGIHIYKREWNKYDPSMPRGFEKW